MQSTISGPNWASIATERLEEIDRFISGESQSVAHIRQHLAQEVEVLARSKADISARLNSLLPISRFPLEMLNHVFSLLVEIDPPTPIPAPEVIPQKPRLGNLGWIGVTHVCRHWRKVALNSPLLWTSVIFVFPTASKDILRRSGSSPFAIRYNFQTDTVVPDAYHAVHRGMRKLSRVTRINLTTYSQFIHHLATTSMTQAAPLLQELSFNICGDGTPVRTPDILYHLPTDLFAGEAPHLRRLSLIHCLLPWDSPLFRNLIYLEMVLYDHRAPVDLLPSEDQLYSILERLPLLEELLLSYLPLTTSLAHAPSDTVRPVISFPILKRLWLDGEMNQCLAFWRNLSVPFSARVHMTCYGVNTEEGCIALVSIIKPLFDHTQRSNPLLALSLSDISTLSLGFWVPVSPSHGWANDVKSEEAFGRLQSYVCPISLAIAIKWPGLEYIPTVSRIFGEFNLRNIQSLVLDIKDTDVLECQWSDVFGHMQGVRSLFVRYGQARRVICALVSNLYYDEGSDSSSSQDEDEDMATTVLLPALRELWLDTVDFRYFSGHDTILALQHLAVPNGTLEVLKLERCPTAERWLTQLREHVAVEWNGILFPKQPPAVPSQEL